MPAATPLHTALLFLLWSAQLLQGATALNSTGPCQVVGPCVQSSGFPTSNYGNNEACTIRGFEGRELQFERFGGLQGSILGSMLGAVRVRWASFGTSGCLVGAR